MLKGRGGARTERPSLFQLQGEKTSVQIDLSKKADYFRLMSDLGGVQLQALLDMGLKQMQPFLFLRCSAMALQ